jgi:acetylornithine deacetylase/succinyl-diaminopimelate desuccinylase-like protein
VVFLQTIELLKNLIAIDSTDAHGTRQIAEYLALIASEYQLKSQLFVENIGGVDQANLVLFPAHYSDSFQGKDLLLVVNLDTENPGDYAQWTRNGANPFSASVIGNSMFGLGVHTKADIVAKIKTLSTRKIKSEFRPVFVGTFGAEKSTGIRRLIRKKILKPQLAVIGAPTQSLYVEKSLGYARVDIRIPFNEEERKYRLAHDLIEMGQTQSKIFIKPNDTNVNLLENNPIFKLVEYFSQLPDGIIVMNIEGGASAATEPDSAYIEIDLVGNVNSRMVHSMRKMSQVMKDMSAELMSVKDADFNPPHSSFVLGQIKTLTDEVVLSGICRLVPVSEKNQYEKWIEKLKSSVEAIGASIHIESFVPPFSAKNTNAIMQNVIEINQQCNISLGKAVGLSTSASLFQIFGCDAFIFGPGHLNLGQHMSQNFVQLNEIENAIRFYSTLADNLNIGDQ